MLSIQYQVSRALSHSLKLACLSEEHKKMILDWKDRLFFIVGAVDETFPSEIRVRLQLCEHGLQLLTQEGLF